MFLHRLFVLLYLYLLRNASFWNLISCSSLKMLLIKEIPQSCLSPGTGLRVIREGMESNKETRTDSCTIAQERLSSDKSAERRFVQIQLEDISQSSIFVDNLLIGFHTLEQKNLVTEHFLEYSAKCYASHCNIHRFQTCPLQKINLSMVT